MFACVGAVDAGVSVKCADVETAQMLIDAGVARRARYFHRSWVNLPDETADDELAHRVTGSYDLVRGKLPKKIRETLPSRAKEEV
jgi:predicted DNA-binding protein (MmcQ/YjbR family)